MRACVIMPRSPTSTTRFSLKRRTASVSGSRVSPSNTSTVPSLRWRLGSARSIAGCAAPRTSRARWSSSSSTSSAGDQGRRVPWIVLAGAVKRREELGGQVFAGRQKCARRRSARLQTIRMPDVLGYARISTAAQDLEVQHRRLREEARAIRIFDDIERRRGYGNLAGRPRVSPFRPAPFCLERAHAGKRILLGGVPGTGKGGDPGRRRGRRERDPWSPRKGLRRFRLVAAKKNSHAWTDGWTRKDSDKSLGPP
jgi:hypothetical protein